MSLASYLRSFGSKQLPQYMREMKIYHMAHHFKNFELGYGVTSKFWDVVSSLSYALVQPEAHFFYRFSARS